VNEINLLVCKINSWDPYKRKHFLPTQKYQITEQLIASLNYKSLIHARNYISNIDPFVFLVY
jgi:hypothetical protein